MRLLLRNRDVVPRRLIERTRWEIGVDAHVGVFLTPNGSAVADYQEFSRNIESADLLVALNADVADRGALTDLLRLNEPNETQLIPVHPHLIRSGVANLCPDDIHGLPLPGVVADDVSAHVQRVQPVHDRGDWCDVYIGG